MNAPSVPNASLTYEDVRSSGRVTARAEPRTAGAPSDPADYVTIDEAAPRLALTPLALRARCRRAARRDGRIVAAHLGGGVVAYKFGRSWRVRFAASPT